MVGSVVEKSEVADGADFALQRGDVHQLQIGLVQRLQFFAGNHRRNAAALQMAAAVEDGDAALRQAFGEQERVVRIVRGHDDGKALRRKFAHQAQRFEDIAVI